MEDSDMTSTDIFRFDIHAGTVDVPAEQASAR
jgi:hypothetical protein